VHQLARQLLNILAPDSRCRGRPRGPDPGPPDRRHSFASCTPVRRPRRRSRTPPAQRHPARRHSVVGGSRDGRAAETPTTGPGCRTPTAWRCSARFTAVNQDPTAEAAAPPIRQ
jgi:hypothetical protein